MSNPSTKGISRRRLISGSAAGLTLAAVSPAQSTTITGIPRWMLFDHNNPIIDETPGLQFFTPDEAVEIDAIVSQLIPSDEYSCNGKEAGCTIFIDCQLAGFMAMPAVIIGKHLFRQVPPRKATSLPRPT